MHKIFTKGPYVIFTQTNESGESFHVHLSRSSPSASNIKIWILRDGSTEIQKNPDYRIIPERDLQEICKQISRYSSEIGLLWVSIHKFLKSKDSKDDPESKTSLFN